jgi:hypothetical protein
MTKYRTLELIGDDRSIEIADKKIEEFIKEQCVLLDKERYGDRYEEVNKHVMWEGFYQMKTHLYERLDDRLLIHFTFEVATPHIIKKLI